MGEHTETKKKQIFENGFIYNGFIVTKSTEIEEIHCQLIELTHRSSGAQVMHVAIDDPENLLENILKRPFVTPAMTPVKVTDEGIALLIKLKNMKSINLPLNHRGGVSHVGIEKLKAEHPAMFDFRVLQPPTIQPLVIQPDLAHVLTGGGVILCHDYQGVVLQLHFCLLK